jgi:hypothetical protein
MSQSSIAIKLSRRWEKVRGLLTRQHHKRGAKVVAARTVTELFGENDDEEEVKAEPKLDKSEYVEDEMDSE